MLFEHLLTRYRGLFATVVLLPISVTYAIWLGIRNRIVFLLKSAPAKHDLKVQKVIEQIEDWKQEGCKEKLCTARFYLIPWSHGTLGFLVSAKLKIIPAKKYIRLKYLPLYSLDDLVRTFEEESRNTEKNDFVEGILFSLDTAVVMLGKLSDEIGTDGKLNRIRRWFKPWFYKHVETYLASGQRRVEYIPLRDYYHRHTRSYFWTMEEIIPFGNHPLFRWALGWALPPRVELLKYTETETTKNLREKHYVIQDMLMPMVHLKKSIEYFDGHYNIYPLWLAPMAIYDNSENIGIVHPFATESGGIDELYVDIGAYGTPRKEQFDNRKALPLLEKFVVDNKGYQALYAKTSLSRDDFSKMFDHQDYDQLRQSLPDCIKAFDQIFDKVSSTGRASPIELRKMKKR